MRILDVNSSYSPTGGGVRTYHRKKQEFFSLSTDHVCALAVPGREDGLQVEGGRRTYRLRSVPLFDSGYRMIVESGGLNHVMLDFRPDIVEVGSPYLLPSLIRSALGNSPVPTVGFYHTDFPDCYVAPYVDRNLPRPLAEGLLGLARRHAGRTYRSMTAVFAASRCMLRKLRDLGVRRLFHTPLGVDTDRFSPEAFSEGFRKSAGVPHGGVLVLYMARLHWEKGLDRLMEAYPLFRDPGRIKLVIGGRGPHDHLVDEFMLKYPEVVRLPYLSGRDLVAEAMASADVYLALGSYETFGLAGLEAIASGTLPVFPDRGASAEMASSLGLMEPYRSESAESLAAAVEEAVRTAGITTADRLRRYALSGHSWKDAFMRMEGYYSTILTAYAENDLERLDPPGEWWD
ncbi:MAG: glycosyltransferase [Candidatus Aegiribacteria sp.]